MKRIFQILINCKAMTVHTDSCVSSSVPTLFILGAVRDLGCAMNRAADLLTHRWCFLLTVPEDVQLYRSPCREYGVFVPVETRKPA